MDLERSERREMVIAGHSVRRRFAWSWIFSVGGRIEA